MLRAHQGTLRGMQAAANKHHYDISSDDLGTRDYSESMTPDKVFANVRKYTRNGSIIVFHDSLKAWRNLKYALPKSTEWLQQQGYEFMVIPGD